MTEILIAAAINIAISLAINALFPPPDIVQEGPRLNDLEFSSSAYGRPTNVLFGTVRVPGNIIWGEPIEEVKNEETEGGKGKGGSVTSISYTYFATFDIAFAINGADDILRLWADGKLIFDKTGSVGFNKAGLNFTIYPGGELQQKDPLETASLTDADTPAYRHLTRIVFNRMPLADYGNRIPSITAEVTFNGTKTFPFIGLQEKTGVTLGTLSKMAVDERTNSFFALSEQLGVEAYRADRNTGVIQAFTTTLSPLLTTGYGWDIMLGSSGGANSVPIRVINAITGQEVAQSDFDILNGVGGYFAVHKIGDPVIGEAIIGVKGGNSIVGNQYTLFFIRRQNSEPVLLETFVPGSAADNPIANEVNITIMDDERGSDSQNIYVVSINGSDTRVGRIFFTVGPSQPLTTGNALLDIAAAVGDAAAGDEGPQIDFLHFSEVLSEFTFPSGSATPTGWAVDASTGRLLISNGSSTVLYDPSTQSVVTSSTEIGFDGQNNYIRGGIFGYAKGNATTGEIVLVNPADLSVIRRDSLSLVGWAGGNGVDDASSVWDDAGQAVIFSRLSGFTGDANERVVRVLINRGTGTGVTLASIITALMTNYEGLPMADLDPGDFDVSTLTGLNVEGYNIGRQSTVRAALEPLRQSYFFDAVQSDWTIKFPLRGGSSVLTIPEDQVGQAKFSDQGPNDFLQETRTQEGELPMRLNFRYTNRETDYDTDVEQAKRLLKPNKAMFSNNERTIDVPIVFNGGLIPKQAAEQWLFTLWNERTQYTTIIPWTYLKLDPTDIFTMGLFGETAQMRLAEQDIGLGLLTEITGIKESAFTYSSSVLNAPPDGFLTQAVPSQDATKLILLDAPLLTALDINQGQSSQAYAAMGAFTPSWPGAVAHISTDGTLFERRSNSNSEMAWGVVIVAPSALGLDNDCGDFPNRFQELADGGTMTVAMQRREDALASTSELSVLNGQNTLAVVTSNGVEIIQFQDVSVPDSDQPTTLKLDRLLRGRFGTEDIALAGGPSNGDEVVLLRAETIEAAIIKMNIIFSNINRNLSYKASTLGTLLADAFSQSFIYTGRDLRPYRPAHVATVPVADPANPDDFAVLVMNFEGVDAATSGVGFDNIGTEGSQPTEIVATSQIDTAEIPAGGDSISSLLLDGNSDYLRWTDRAAWELGSGPVTITAHFRLNATGVDSTIASQYRATGDQRSWFLKVNTSNNLTFQVWLSGTTMDIGVTGSTALTTGVDYHVAVVRKNDGDWVLFLDGAIEAGPTTPTGNPFNTTSDFRIGALDSGGVSQFFNGWIDSFQLIIGAAKWETTFTPPTGNINADPSALDVTWERRTRINGEWLDGTGEVPLNETTETYDVTLAVEHGPDLSLFMSMGGADDSTEAIDLSPNAHTLIYGADAKVSTEQQKFGDASLELTGIGANPSTSFIQLPDSTTFEFGSGQFTVDCFVRFSDLSDTEQTIASKYLNTGDEREWIFERNGNSLRFIYSLDGTGSLTTISGAFTFLVDTWYHVVVDRDTSDDIRLYVDGVVVGGPTAAAVTIFAGTAVPFIGKIRSAGFDDFPMTGFVDDLVIFKGRALYGGAFTSRTTAFPSGQGFITKRVNNVKLANFTEIEQALGQGEPLRADVRQISGTDLRSSPASCLIP